MRIFFKTAFFMLACFFIQSGFAQKPAGKKPATATQKFKPPKLYTTLGSFKDSTGVPLEQALNIIAMPLKIVDDKNTEYRVSSYQFLYKRRVVTEDEQTGKVSPASSILSNRFTSTPLPEIWVNNIGQELKAGEELFFFDVIARDAQGRVINASSLKIIVQ